MFSKKIGLIFCVAFLSCAGIFADDYRELLFGNNYKNIIRIQDKAKVDQAVKDVMPYISRSYDSRNWGYENYLFEEKYENGTIYRLVALKAFDKFGKRYSDTTLEEIADWESFYPEDLMQTVFVKIDNRVVVLFCDNIFYRIMADGTTHSSVGWVLKGVEVIQRDNKIVMLCEHVTTNRRTYYTAMDEDDYVKEDEYDRHSFAYFREYYYIFESYNVGLVELSNHSDFSLTAPMAEIDDEHPFKYTIQNLFDNNSETTFVPDYDDCEQKFCEFFDLKQGSASCAEIDLLLEQEKNAKEIEIRF